MSMNLADFISALNDDFAAYCSEQLGDCGITPAQISFLAYIGENPNCSPTELAHAVNADTGHTTRCVKKLVACGMATRNRHKSDGRAFVLHLTDRGMSILAEVRTIYREWEDGATSALDRDEGAQLIALLQKMRGVRP